MEVLPVVRMQHKKHNSKLPKNAPRNANLAGVFIISSPVLASAVRQMWVGTVKNSTDVLICQWMGRVHKKINLGCDLFFREIAAHAKLARIADLFVFILLCLARPNLRMYR